MTTLTSRIPLITMQYPEVLARIYNLKRFGSKLGLDNIKELLRLLVNPEQGLRFVHIGGTNGKGSVSVMVAAVLQEAGYKVGLFTSPHLHRFSERIRINGKEISKSEIKRLAKQILFLSKKMASSANFSHPTFFEVAFAMALKYFAEQKVDFVVLEVGLGGRLDATNVVKPLVAVITNIEIEHSHILGKTLALIAREKAGIIKKDTLVITAETKRDILEFFKRKCRAAGSKMVCVNKDYLFEKRSKYFSRQKIFVKGKLNDYRVNLHLLGSYQLPNTATAIAAVEALARYGFVIDRRTMEKGLAKARWPGRFEVLQRKPLVIVDCAHNPAGIKELARAMKEVSYGRLFLVIAVSQDKDIKKMIKNIAPLVDTFIISQAGYRGMAMQKIKNEVVKTKKSFLTRRKVQDAVRQALRLADEKDMVCIAGSIYLADEARRLWKKVIVDPEQA